MRYCPNCNTDKQDSEFYWKKDGKINHAYCKKCQNQNVLNRQRKFKRLAIEYKGGKCICCGYDKYDGALDFHHIDPSQKDFNLGAGRLRKFEHHQLASRF